MTKDLTLSRLCLRWTVLLPGGLIDLVRLAKKVFSGLCRISHMTFFLDDFLQLPLHVGNTDFFLSLTFHNSLFPRLVRAACRNAGPFTRRGAPLTEASALKGPCISRLVLCLLRAYPQVQPARHVAHVHLVP